MSSNAGPHLWFSAIPVAFAYAMLFSPSAVAAQDDSVVTQAGDEAAEKSEPEDPAQDFDSGPVNILITVPRGEVNQAQAQECEDRADAGAISGEIVVCRQIGDSGENSLSGSRDAAQKRYAEETAFKGSPRAPNFSNDCRAQGNPFGCIGLGGIPEAAIFIDVEALPQAPEGSDADRIARGLPPLGESPDPSPEEIAARRRALGLEAPPVPSAPE